MKIKSSHPVEYVGGLFFGFIMCLTACYALIKIKSGSQDRFATTMMYFSLCYGTSYILYFFFICFGRDVTNSEGVTQPRFNFYLVYMNAYFYYWCALQQWLFATNYTAGALKAGSSYCYLNLKVLKKIEDIVFWLYTAYLVVLMIVTLCVFPGWYDVPQLEHWQLVTFPRLQNSVNIFWLPLNITSTVLSLVAMYRIQSTIRQTEKYDLNKRIIVLHAVLIVLMTVAVTLNSIPYRVIEKGYYKTLVVVMIFDFAMQLILAYICYQLGDN